jgi:beta-glucosidase
MDWATHEFFFHAIRTGEVVLPGRDAEYVPEAKGAIDFWAVNYYTRHMIDARKRGLEGQRFAHQRTRMIPMDFFLEEAFPEGLIANLERLKDKPVIITENGCCCDDDRWRVLALATHLCALREAIDRGVDVRGYFHWSFMDNFEWGSFVPRFGLVSVDFKTFKRTPKPSAWFFKEVIERNGFDRKLLAKYLKGFPKLKQY